MNATIASLMQAPFSTIAMDDTVAQVDALLTEKKLNWVPVMEGGTTVVGAIGAHDLLRFHADGRDAAGVRAWQICSYRPLTVERSTPAAAVAREMVERHVHHVVVTEGAQIVGVVSSLDFVKAYADAAERQARP